MIISVEDYLKQAQHKGIQTYWALWLYSQGLSLDHKPESCHEYINWINTCHRSFRPGCDCRITQEYKDQFLSWLKDWVSGCPNLPKTDNTGQDGQ